MNISKQMDAMREGYKLRGAMDIVSAMFLRKGDKKFDNPRKEYVSNLNKQIKELELDKDVSKLRDMVKTSIQSVAKSPFINPELLDEMVKALIEDEHSELFNALQNHIKIRIVHKGITKSDACIQSERLVKSILKKSPINESKFFSVAIAAASDDIIKDSEWDNRKWVSQLCIEFKHQLQ